MGRAMSDPRLTNQLFLNSFGRYSGTTGLAGPFHRKRSRSQTSNDDLKQMNSGILWGDVPQSGTCPTAQAYFGPLQPHDNGIEFLTPILPHQTGLPNGFGANWYLDHTAYTGSIASGSRALAAITIVVVKHQP